jgi:hypothetical protein
MEPSTATDTDFDELYMAVGEFVLLNAALDDMAARMLSAIFILPDENPFVHPLISTLDPARRIEILKQRTSGKHESGLFIALRSFTSEFEEVNRVRNEACHSSARLGSDGPCLHPRAAAKLLRHLSKTARDPEPSLPTVPLARLKEAARRADLALGQGMRLAEELRAVASKMARFLEGEQGNVAQ